MLIPSAKINNNSSAVCVAVRIRPQNAREKAENASICVSSTPGESQITIGRDKAFTYDYVFAEQTKQEAIYNSCISGLLEGTFDGYNATVLAYGQTGSGKTYTMGTSFDANQLHAAEHLAGIIPRAAQHIFNGIELRKSTAKEAGQLEPSFEIGVQFIELYNEEIIDLLAADGPRAAIKIQEEPIRNEISLRGAVWQPVLNAQDVMDALKGGALNRTTAATNMNQQSSRSHAIFTVQLKQTRVVPVESNEDGSPKSNESELEVLHAKFHFVDLAGSERLKRTGATGDRAKEGISINSGLLALGNVISALGGASGRVSHVPYRDSKLTRLLQDSLGGNSRTLMIACASPSDVDFVETLNTLNYANRAKNIKNRVVANQDKSSKLLNEMRARIVALEVELQEYKQGKRLVDENGEEIINDQFLENQQLQNENNGLRARIKGLDGTIEILQQRIVAMETELEMTKLRAGIASGLMENKENDGADAIGEQQFSAMIEGYLQELQSLKIKLIEVNSTNEALRKQNHYFRTQLEQQGMVASSSLPGSPFMLQSGGIAGGLSQDVLIRSARAEIARQKKALQNATIKANSPIVYEYEEEAIDAADEEDQQNDDEEEAIDDEEMATDEDDDDDLEAEAPEIRQSQEHIRLVGEVAQLQEDINLKERLVQELEASQRRMDQMRQNYEKKLTELASRIQTTETERDNILAEMTAKKPTQKQKEDIQKVRDKYEKELATMRMEHRRLELAERENKKMQAQQSRQQSECGRFKLELESMKRQKVDLMKQLKEEGRRMRELQTKNAQKMATMEKLQRQQQNKINRLERETAMKGEHLKRKAEEIQRMKAQQKRRETIFEPNRRGAAAKNAQKEKQQKSGAASSTSAIDATFVIEKPRIPMPTLLNFDDNENEDITKVLASSAAAAENNNEEKLPTLPEKKERKARRTTMFQTPKQMIIDGLGAVGGVGIKSNKRRSQAADTFTAIQHTPIRTKRQWSAMERAIDCLVNRKNAVAFEEQAMNRLINERHRLQEELARLSAQSACTMDMKVRADILEEQEAIQEKLNYIQGEILKYQKNIVELEDQVIEFEPINRRSAHLISSAIPTLEDQTNVANLDSLMLRFSREYNIPSEAQYIVRNLLDTIIQKGTEVVKLQADVKELTGLLGLDSNEDVREVMEARNQQQLMMCAASSNGEDVKKQPTAALDLAFDTTFMVPPTPQRVQDVKSSFAAECKQMPKQHQESISMPNDNENGEPSSSRDEEPRKRQKQQLAGKF